MQCSASVRNGERSTKQEMESQDSEFSSLDSNYPAAADNANQPSHGFLDLTATEELSTPEVAWLEANFLSRSLPWLEYLQTCIKPPKDFPEATVTLGELISTRRYWLKELSEAYPVNPETARERRIAIRCLNHLANWDSVYPELKSRPLHHRQRALAERMKILLASEKRHLDFLEQIDIERTDSTIDLHREELRLQLEQLQYLNNSLENH
jgi:hypothetical protein